MNLVKIDGYVEGDIIPLEEAKVGMIVHLIRVATGNLYSNYRGVPLRYLVVGGYDGMGIDVQYHPITNRPTTQPSHVSRAMIEKFSRVQVISYEPNLFESYTKGR